MPLRTVILRHDCPDGAGHFDWLLAVDEEGRQPLLTWRCERRPDDVEAGQEMRIERLSDHRPIYLDYEGPISGGRGSVAHLRDGIWIAEGDLASGSAAVRLRVRWRGEAADQWWVLDAAVAWRVE